MSGLSILWDFMNPVRIWENLNFAKKLREDVLKSGLIEKAVDEIGVLQIPRPTSREDLGGKVDAVSTIAVVQKLDGLSNLHKGYVYDAFAGISLWGVLFSAIGVGLSAISAVVGT